MNDPSPATNIQATVRILEDQDVVTVIERFDVSARRQPEAAGQASEHIAREWVENPEFVAAVLLQGRAHGGITSYSQWKGPGAGSAPAEVPGAWSISSALPAFTMLDSRTYKVEFTDSATPPSLLSLEGTPMAHFGIFGVTRENQDRLLDLARENAPRSLQVTGGLISINFHRSVDGLQVINLGTWTTFDHMYELLQQPGFREDSVYWGGVADFQPDFFDVVLVEVSR